jgi:hypothetical protein
MILRDLDETLALGIWDKVPRWENLSLIYG